MCIIKKIYNLFYPTLCLTCDKPLVKNESIICTSCRHSLPETDFVDVCNNTMEAALNGRVPYVAATALLYYQKKGKVQSQKRNFLSLQKVCGTSLQFLQKKSDILHHSRKNYHIASFNCILLKGK